MTRWLTIVAMVGLLATGAARPNGVQAGPDTDPALWRAAGVMQLSSPAPPPPLNLRDLSGELVDLRSLRGRVVMIYFWATW
jgi:hypothetical protein